jgi:hypothetical protein
VKFESEQEKEERGKKGLRKSGVEKYDAGGELYAVIGGVEPTGGEREPEITRRSKE